VTGESRVARLSGARRTQIVHARPGASETNCHNNGHGPYHVDNPGCLANGSGKGIVVKSITEPFWPTLSIRQVIDSNATAFFSRCGIVWKKLLKRAPQELEQRETWLYRKVFSEGGFLVSGVVIPPRDGNKSMIENGESAYVP
jgi:hypothetical protein